MAEYPTLTDYDILGSTLGDAKASGLSLDDVIYTWYNCNTLEEFDAAISALGTLRMIEQGKRAWQIQKPN